MMIEITATACVAATFVVCGCIGLANLLHVRRSIALLEAQRGRTYPLPRDPPYFIILVPLLEEQAVVERLVSALAQLQYPAGRIQIVLVTTARETNDTANRSTAETLRAVLEARGDPRFQWMHCDTGDDQSKADQLNFALRHLPLDRHPAAECFVGVYDADSVPDPRVLAYVADHVAREGGRAFQQIPWYALRLGALPRAPGGWIVRARPLHNALFALTVELPRMRRQASVMRGARVSVTRIARSWLSHAIGHGEFFRLDLLQALGGFRPPSCDTQLGHALAYAGIPLELVPLLDLGETPDTLGALLEQGVVWFNSMNTFPMTWRFLRGLEPPNYSHLGAWAMSLRLANSNVAWACYPVLFLAAALWAVWTRDARLIVGGAAALLLYIAPVAFIAARFDRITSLAGDPAGLTPVDRVLMTLAFPFEKLFASASPWLWAWRQLRVKVYGGSLTLKKTKRLPGISRPWQPD